MNILLAELFLIFVFFTFLPHQKLLNIHFLKVCLCGFHKACSSFSYISDNVSSAFFSSSSLIVSMKAGVPKGSLVTFPIHSTFTLGTWFNFVASANSSIRVASTSFPDFSPNCHSHISSSTSNSYTWKFHQPLGPLPLWHLSHPPSGSTLMISTLVQMLMAFLPCPLKGSLVATNLTVFKFITCLSTKCIFQKYNPDRISPFQKLLIFLHPPGWSPNSFLWCSNSFL